MNTNIILPVHDIFSIILYILGAVTLVVLIIGLMKLVKILSQVNNLIGDNRKNIDRVLETAPETLENINETVVQAKSTINRAGSAVGIFSDGVDDTVTEINYGYASIIDVVKAVGDVVRLISSIISSK